MDGTEDVCSYRDEGDEEVSVDLVDDCLTAKVWEVREGYRKGEDEEGV